MHTHDRHNIESGISASTVIGSRAASLWQRILRTDRQKLFGADAARLLDRHEGDKLAQPGYVGPSYQPGGLVLVGMNPGGGPQDGLGPADRDMYSASQAVREASPDELVPAFRLLTARLAEVMPTWKLHRNVVALVLAGTGRTMDDIAYVNLLKWRTDSSSGLSRLYKLSWADHTREQIELLAPGHVVGVGVDAGHSFARLYIGDALVGIVPRVIGDNIGQPGRDAIAQIIAALDGGAARAGG